VERGENKRFDKGKLSVVLEEVADGLDDGEIVSWL
jgi:hypothetical protein